MSDSSSARGSRQSTSDSSSACGSRQSLSHVPAPTNRLALSGRRLARNTASRTFGSVISLAAGTVAGLLVARELGPDRFGSFSVVWAIAWAAGITVPLGFDLLLVRELNRRPPLLDPA
ncbi:MAG: hypothetical protein ACRDUY_15210, partial [Nitriliruptorales bacterium]